MSAKPTKVPGFPKPPTSISAELRKFLEAIVEAIEIRPVSYTHLPLPTNREV